MGSEHLVPKMQLLFLVSVVTFAKASPFEPLLRSLGVHGDCSDVYSQDSNNCDDGCGRCFNPKGRSSTDDVEVVMCPASGSPGYYCNSDGGVLPAWTGLLGAPRLQSKKTLSEPELVRM